MIYKAEEPIVNEATIDSIPPIGVPYPLSTPVVYRPNRRWLPTLELISCVVKMMNEERLKLTVEDVSTSSGRGSIKVRIDNISNHAPLKVFWHIKTTDGITARLPKGILTLRQKPKRLLFDLDSHGFSGETQVTVAAGIIAPTNVPGARGENIPLVF